MISFAKEIDSVKKFPFRFSICTLVSDKNEYEEMVNSFLKAGFDPSFCEYLFIDNTEKNKLDAFAGLNNFLTFSKGQYIILCHQDILLNFDRIEKLEKCIEEVNSLYPEWGLLGNAGGVNLAENASKIATASGKIFDEGPLPREVQSLDENFILVKKEANLGLSHDLNGFHLYGSDICRVAQTLGYKAYVINFLLTHKSYGKPDKSFFELKNKLIQKYQKIFAGKFIRTTITIFYLSGSSVRNYFYNRKFVIKIAKFFTRLNKKK